MMELIYLLFMIVLCFSLLQRQSYRENAHLLQDFLRELQTKLLLHKTIDRQSKNTDYRFFISSCLLSIRRGQNPSTAMQKMQKKIIDLERYLHTQERTFILIRSHSLCAVSLSILGRAYLKTAFAIQERLIMIDIVSLLSAAVLVGLSLTILCHKYPKPWYWQNSRLTQEAQIWFRALLDLNPEQHCSFSKDWQDTIEQERLTGLCGKKIRQGILDMWTFSLEAQDQQELMNYGDWLPLIELGILLLVSGLIMAWPVWAVFSQSI